MSLSDSDTAPEDESSEPAKNKKDASRQDDRKSKKDDGGIPDDILDMFGDSDEND